MAESETAPRRSWLTALLAQRCPRCRKGRIFQSLTVGYERCPACGLVFEREPGYFMGALYISYALGIIILVPFYFIFRWLLPDWSNIAVASISLAPYLPLTLLVYRYSRVIWIYFDRSMMSVERPN